MSRKKYVVESAFESVNVQKIMQIAIDANGRIVNWTDSAENIEELNSDYINEHFGQLQDETYRRGFEDGKGAIHNGCEGCQYEGKVVTGPPCITCCNSYINQWTAKKQDDEIKVGDIVERYINGKLDSTGIYLGEDGGYWNCLFWTGTVFGTFAYPKNQFKKTGRHVDITDMLKGALE